MKELKAFVGHSFNEHDESLIRIFCDHFENLAKTNLNFSWDHAVGAEPSPLSQKVLEKIQGKNVFIGICTRHELAVRDSRLRPSLFRRRVLCAEAENFKWKASDWIIQEIGLAVGRQMSIIIFLEEGVREPGGLYGNIEYIPFSRDNPHSSFDKLLQMLFSLSPKEPIGSTASAESLLSAPAKRDDEPPELEPKPDWTEAKYYGALGFAVLGEDAAALAQISKAFCASKYSTGLGVAEWEGRVEWLKIIFGKQGDFEKLKSLANENLGSSRLQMFLARVYDELGEHARAAEAYQRASLTSDDDAKRVTYDSDAAVQYAHADEFERALSLFERAKKGAKGQPPALESIAADLRTLAQIEKNDELELAALEHSVELHPADWNLRFQLAYRHSQCSNDDMAFYHYSKIPAQSRDSVTWNNLGVSFANFAMPAKSIGAFRRAEGLDDTLAMSNLGLRLLSAGFVKEAADLSNKALGVASYHPNVTELLKQLKEVPEEEDNTEIEILAKVKPKAAFYRQLGDAALAEAPNQFGKRWQAPEATFDALFNGMDIRIWGSYEQDENALTATGLLGGIARRKVTRRVQYNLKLRGRALIGEVERTTDGENPILSAIALTDRRVVLHLRSDGAELRAMEGARFYSLRLIE